MRRQIVEPLLGEQEWPLGNLFARRAAGVPDAHERIAAQMRATLAQRGKKPGSRNIDVTLIDSANRSRSIAGGSCTADR
jgi:hypothetical protein